MPKVFVRKASYGYENLKPLLFEIMDSIGGSRIKEHTRVLVKPNLLAPAAPERAMLTHPDIVRGVVEYALMRGGKVQVSDSPAMGTFEKVLRESGIKDALKGLDVECKEFKASVAVDVGEPFGTIELAEDALRADVVINLPKLKTHSQMVLTLAVKNLFGCVVGLRKPEWHLRAGVDREMFAMLIAQICKAIGPSFNILDGVLGMEGQGPGKGGVPKEVGVIAGSADPVALDMAVCGMLGLEAETLLTTAAARKLGMIPSDSLEVVGDTLEKKELKLPEITPLVFGPRWSHTLLRKHLVQRPVPDESLCRLCGDCLRYCPAGAITSHRKRINFDYNRCIRCYCCIEVCPHGALRAKEPFLGRLFSRVIQRTS